MAGVSAGIYKIPLAAAPGFVVLLETPNVLAVNDPLQTSRVGTTMVRGSWGHSRSAR